MKKILYLLITALVFVLTFSSCHKQNDSAKAVISEIVDIQENAIGFMNNQTASEHNLETIINNCIQQLTQNPSVTSACLQDSDQIVIRYKSGATGVILLVEEEEQRKLETKPYYKKSFNDSPKGGVGDTLITNHKVLIWEAFPFNEASMVKNKFTSCSEIDFKTEDIDVYTGNQCTVQSLRDIGLTEYGFVYISSHGGYLANIQGDPVCWILTTDKPQNATMLELTSDAKIIVTVAKVKYEWGQEIREVRLDLLNTYWGVSNVFFSKYVSGTFNTPSIVYVSACNSFRNSGLADVFVNEKKASVYFGFTHSVSTAFAYDVASKFLDNMLNKKLSAYCAYDELEVKQDPYKPQKAWLIRRLKENATYFGPKGFVECPALGKRWELTEVFYNPDPYVGTTHFSQLLLLGNNFRIGYRLSKMNSMAEGSYTPYIINDIGADTLWETNFYPMRFLAGTYSGVNGSSFWHQPETHSYAILGGELKYQKQNNLNKFTFDIIGDDGYSYHGEYAGEIYQ